jgi:hypothetical protein
MDTQLFCGIKRVIAADSVLSLCGVVILNNINIG